MDRNRREFLKDVIAGGTVTAAAPLTLITPTPAHARATGNLFNILRKHDFTDVNGQEVNTSALRQSLKNQFTTVSFGFMGCSDFCPLALNTNLEALGKTAGDKLTRIIINVAPESEGVSPFRDTYPDYLRGVGLSENTLVLFPASNAEAVKLQTEFGMFVNKKDPSKHSAKVILYKPGGDYAAEKLATRPESEFIQDWGAMLSSLGKDRQP